MTGPIAGLLVDFIQSCSLLSETYPASPHSDADARRCFFALLLLLRAHLIIVSRTSRRSRRSQSCCGISSYNIPHICGTNTVPYHRQAIERAPRQRSLLCAAYIDIIKPYEHAAASYAFRAANRTFHFFLPALKTNSTSFPLLRARNHASRIISLRSFRSAIMSLFFSWRRRQEHRITLCALHSSRLICMWVLAPETSKNMAEKLKAPHPHTARRVANMSRVARPGNLS